MSGYAGGSGESNGGGGLDNLFAQMRKQNSNGGAASSNGAANTNLLQMFGGQRNDSNPYFAQSRPLQTHQSQHAYHQASVSSPIPTPPVDNQQPHHTSAIMSPASEVSQSRNVTPIGSTAAPGNLDSRSANLLNLLKYTQPTSASTPSTQQAPISAPRPTSHPGSGNSDLLSAFLGQSQPAAAKENKQPKKVQQPLSHMQSAVSGLASNPAPPAKAPSAETENFLLALLNRPKPAQTDPEPHLEPATGYSFENKGRESSGDEMSELARTLGHASLNKKPATPAQNILAASTPATSQGLFTYVNPFDQLAASSPRNRTPTPLKNAQSASGTPGTPSVQILKHPRNDAQGPNSDLKRKIDDRTPGSSPSMSSKRKLPSPTSETSSPVPSPLADGRTHVEALIGIGGSGKGKETVSEALSDVGGQVDKQVEEALARAEEDESQDVIERDMRDLLDAKTEEEFEKRAQIAAIDIKKELDKDGNEDVLDGQLPRPVAQAVKDIIANAAQGNLADSWESAELDDSPKSDHDDALTPVFMFPMHPFQSVTLASEKIDAKYPLPTLREDAVMDVARLKKEFDQIDRTLVTASNDFIVYGMSKNGGIRVIRQQDGKDVKLFTETKDRIFNVSCSNSKTDPTETVIGTGISGTVYWAQIKGADGDYVETGSPEKLGFSLPPFKNTGDESSGGVLKTRARKSSNHPEFFAVGRGKSIHIIWPAVIMKQGYLMSGPERTVDIEKYLSHRSLKINTGKAGKDFTFSPDDTAIVSLDKAGRMKFWDVRTLTQTDRGTESRYPAPEQIEPVEIKEPLMTLNATQPNEKSWPTSVMFVDRIRAYQKPGPLRYLIVGMKQNHTLQFWDLLLGRMVQELHLPHTKESDAVCSVLYHAATGIIVVGHPTRNSIYLIQLSAPRYDSYKSPTQADFISRLAAHDPSITRPSNTCVLSSMREYSLEPKGILRSLEILPAPNSAVLDSEDPTLFELYAMHSKGVTCIYIKSEDLGLDKDSKIIYPVIMKGTDLINVGTIAETSAPSSAVSSPAVTRSTPRILPKDVSPEKLGRKSVTSNGHPETHRTPETPKLAALREEIKIESPQSTVSGQESGVAVSPELKKKKKKSAGAGKPSDSQPAASSSATTRATEDSSLSSAKPANGSPLAIQEPNLATLGPASSSASASGLSREAADEIIKKMGSKVSADFTGVIAGSFDTLYQRLDNDQRTQAAEADSKQESLLRLVSSTLSDNVEKTLSNIVSAQIKKSVIPSLSQITAQSVKEQLGPAINSQMRLSFPREVQTALPDALAKVLQKPDVVKLISDSMAKTVAQNVTTRFEAEFTLMIQNSIAPAFKSVAIQAARDASLDIQRQAMEIISGMEVQRQADNVKIEQMSRLLTGLTEIVSSMAAAQEKYQAEFLKHLHQTEQQNPPRRREAPESSRNARPSGSAAAVRQPSQSQPQVPTGQVQQQNPEEQMMLEEIMGGIRDSMNVGNYEDAIMKWLQSDSQQEIFDGYFSKFDPNPLIAGCAPLVVLSIGATLTIQLNGNALLPRLRFLEVTLQVFQASLDDLDEQTAEVTPRILDVIKQRLETLLMRISQVSPQDPLLKRVSNLISATNMMLANSRR